MLQTWTDTQGLSTLSLQSSISQWQTDTTILNYCNYCTTSHGQNTYCATAPLSVYTVVALLYQSWRSVNYFQTYPFILPPHLQTKSQSCTISIPKNSLKMEANSRERYLTNISLQTWKKKSSLRITTNTKELKVKE